MFEIIKEIEENVKMASKEAQVLSAQIEEGKEFKPTTMGEHPVLMNYRDFMFQPGEKPLDMKAVDEESMKRKDNMYGIEQRINDIVGIALGEGNNLPRQYEEGH